MIILNSLTANNIGFWQTNNGELIRGIVGILIAIIAAYFTSYFTNRFTKNRELLKEKDRYQGLLYTIFLDINGHEHSLGLLTTTLLKLKEISLQEKKIIFDSQLQIINFLITEKSTAQVIEYKKYNRNLIALLIPYINNLKDINFYLNFDKYYKVIQDEPDQHAKEQMIVDYFEILNREYIEKTKNAIPLIGKLLASELKDYSNSEKKK